MDFDRNAQSDAAQRGKGARSIGLEAGQQMRRQPNKGAWKPAYGGTMGTRDDEGMWEDQTGVNADRDDGS